MSRLRRAAVRPAVTLKDTNHSRVTAVPPPAHATRSARRVTAAAAVTIAALALVGCGSGSSHTATNRAANVPAANLGPHDSTGVPADVGKPASSFSCADFPPSLVLTAVGTVVPNVQVVPMPPGGKDAPVECGYNIFAPGTDTSSADRGEAQLLIQIDDTWDDTPLEDDPAKNLEHEKAQFADDRSSAGTGESDSSHKSTVSDTSGVGVQAYTETTAQLDESSGAATQWNDALSVLNDKQPFNLRMSIDYVLPQPEDMPKDKSVDTAMRDAGTRGRALDAVAQAVLAKLR